MCIKNKGKLEELHWITEKSNGRGQDVQYWKLQTGADERETSPTSGSAVSTAVASFCILCFVKHPRCFFLIIWESSYQLVAFPKNSFSVSVVCAFPFTDFVKVHYWWYKIAIIYSWILELHKMNGVYMYYIDSFLFVALGNHINKW